MTPEEELERAVRAEQILGDSLFKESCEAIERAILNGIEMSAIKDAEMREKLCLQYILFKSLIGQFRTYMETGRLAEETIRRKSIAERVKAAVNW